MSVVVEPKLKAPFPAFGGKSRAADLVWGRFGEVRNYCEPFCFSAAMLLKRPGGTGAIETINDSNSFVSNFWRAVKADPEAVARHADWIVSEDDLHARHQWLVTSDESIAKLDKVRIDPDYFDAKIAGWWCWGACMWIGSGWCDSVDNGGDHGSVRGIPEQIAQLSAAGRGVHSPAGLHEKRPNTGDSSGKGVNGSHRPQLADAFSRGRGVNGNDAASVCEDRTRWLIGWMNRLADRLRPVRVCCGHWDRICDSDSTLTRLGLTGVFLDPPYRHKLETGETNRAKHIYANDRHQDVGALCDEVQAWCLKWGSDPEIRIALCGLEGEYPLLDAAGWEKVSWKSRGGYGNRSDKGKENAARERTWFNKSCLPPIIHRQQSLFGGNA